MSEAARVEWGEVIARLRPFIARRVPAAEVEDVLQEALLRVHTSQATLRDEERLVAWTYRIARRAVADHLRRAARPQPLAADAGELWEEAGEAGCEDAETLAAFMGAFVAMLPDTTREAVRLAELEGKTMAEVAARLGLSVSGAKSRVQRGRQHMRGLIEACCRVTLDARGAVVEVAPRAATSCPCDLHACGDHTGRQPV